MAPHDFRPQDRTAGWSIPSAVAERLPPPGTHLERYARVMNAVEINTSFYRPHRRQTWERWAASTPEGFRFAVKAPKLLTHDQRLAAPEAVLDRFAEEIAGLGERLGVVLIQLPPNPAFDETLAEAFFVAAEKRVAVPLALEPRHPSWFEPEVDAWLANRRIARVAADPAKVPFAADPGGWRGLTYFRLHGSPRVYYSAYAPEVLATVAERLIAEAAAAPTWCILDNTAGSRALPDALTVRAASGQEP